MISHEPMGKRATKLHLVVGKRQNTMSQPYDSPGMDWEVKTALGGGY